MERLARLQGLPGQPRIARPRAPRGAVVMYCSLAHRGEEITDDVLDGPRARWYSIRLKTRPCAKGRDGMAVAQR